MPHKDLEARRAYAREWARKKRLADPVAARAADRKRYIKDNRAAEVKRRRAKDPERYARQQREWRAKRPPGELRAKRLAWYVETVEERRAYTKRRHNTVAGARAQRLLSMRRKWAIKRDLPFSLTREWVAKRLEAGVCEATGLPLVLDKGMSPWSPSIDRVNPALGYTPENCRVVVYIFNTAKNVYSDSDVEKMALAFLCSREISVEGRDRSGLHVAPTTGATNGGAALRMG